jgi:hypothetical protein
MHKPTIDSAIAARRTRDRSLERWHEGEAVCFRSTTSCRGERDLPAGPRTERLVDCEPLALERDDPRAIGLVQRQGSAGRRVAAIDVSEPQRYV